MTIVGVLKRWLANPPITDALAFSFVFGAVAIPTVIRCLVNETVYGVAFSPYLPFVLLSAIMMGWRHGAAVALLSAAVADMLFIEPRFVPIAGPTDMFGIAVFLTTSALIIFLVQAARFFVRACPGPVPCEVEETGIIFSLERGQAWASWHGAGVKQRLGPEVEVAEMMQDFLAQLELGRRLNEIGR